MKESETTSAGRDLAGACRGSVILTIFLLFGLFMPWAMAQRTVIKPGVNMFSADQDVQLGKEASGEVEKQVQLLNDRRVDDYLNRLGLKLAKVAPGPKFPYSFKAVNDMSINAFALPGGPLYVNRGTIEAADNEAQLAGVMGHEIGHAALRHGTNQLTKAQYTEGILGVLGGVVGSGSWKGVLTQMGAGLFANSVLLKYSRSAETQADIIGTQLLYDNGADPRAMAEFFEKLAAETKGNRTPEWFSSHPRPENRVKNVTTEIKKMGGDRSPYTNDSAEFRQIQSYVRSLPKPAAKPQAAAGTQTGGGTGGRPQAPSARMKAHQGGDVRVNLPDNWSVRGDSDSFTLAPEGGIINDSKGSPAVAWGVISGIHAPQAGSRSSATLEEATNQLLDELKKSNPGMKLSGRGARIELDGNPALSMAVDNDSPVGGRERILLLTVARAKGLRYFVFIAPESEFAAYRPTFEAIAASISFAGR